MPNIPNYLLGRHETVFSCQGYTFSESTGVGSTVGSSNSLLLIMDGASFESTKETQTINGYGSVNTHTVAIRAGTSVTLHEIMLNATVRSLLEAVANAASHIMLTRTFGGVLKTGYFLITRAGQDTMEGKNTYSISIDPVDIGAPNWS